ncbi:MAG: PIN domain-containing protein [Pirellulales bacterium]|nr:PIN domain-containing protein [Pirellulales bacterium]
MSVAVDRHVAARTRLLNDAGIKPLDAAHVACAEAGGCGRLLTCDDRLLRVARAQRLSVMVQNPRDYLEECGHA